MDRWMKAIGRIGRELYEGASAASELVPRIGRPSDRVQIVPYHGYGTAREIRVLARVIEEESIADAARTDSVWRNFVHTLKRMESDEVPGALLRVSAGDVTTRTASDAEGYVDARLVVDSTLPADVAWHDVSLELLSEPHGRDAGVRATARVLVPPASARFGVISDIDDTVVRTDVTNLLRMARTILLTNAYTRLPFPGVAAFYQALRGGGTGSDANPIFYVSQSPWNLYDVLAQYLSIQGIPPGPLLLRDWGRAGRTTISAERGSHKREAIDGILELYPHLPFVLVGDSGQEDPEIYREVVRRFPERVLAIYIRNVTPGPLREASVAALADEVAKAGSTLILADDTMAAARHAAEHGWIRPETLAEVGEERAREEGDARKKGEAEEAPTVEVSPDSAPPV